MTHKNSSQMTVVDFEHLLDVCGADRTRWPLAERAGAAALLAADRDARRLLAHASAFDALLSRASEPAATDIAALADRIVAATIEPRSMGGAGRRGLPFAASVAAPWRVRLGSNGDFVRGAMLLAASLTIGVFVGQTQMGARAVPVFEAWTGITPPVTAERIALMDLHIETVDED